MTSILTFMVLLSTISTFYLSEKIEANPSNERCINPFSLGQVETTTHVRNIFTSETFPKAMSSDLKQLVSFPSVSSAPEQEGMEQAVAYLTKRLRDLSFEVGVKMVDGLPILEALTSRHVDRPTVMFYGHFDVVSADNQIWDQDPFKLNYRHGRYYGRGTADNKGPLTMFLAVLDAFKKSREGFPVNIVMLLDGGEEEGRSISEFLESRRDIYSQVSSVLICDGMNVDPSRGSIEIGSRGYLSMTAKVKTGERSVHSGSYGGAIPSASVALTRLLSSLHNDDQSIAVATLNQLLRPIPDSLQHRVDSMQLREIAGMAEGVPFVGNSNDPFASIVRGSAISYSMSPSAVSDIAHGATASIAVRLGPGMIAGDAFSAINKFLEKRMHDIPGILTLTQGAQFPYNRFDPNHPFLSEIATDAMTNVYGRSPVFTEDGGTTPLFSELYSVMGAVPVLFYGASDSQSNWHGANESVSSDLLEKSGLVTIQVLEAILNRQIALGASDLQK